MRPTLSPSRARWLYVAAYVVVWAAYALMVKASKVNGHYPYNLFSCTLVIECVKLGLAYAYYRHLKQRNPGQCFSSPCITVVVSRRAFGSHFCVHSFLSHITEAYAESLASKWAVAKFFAIPSAIYTLYNALAFVNLRLLEPATYRVLINVKIITSGLLFQYVFGKVLGVKQYAPRTHLVCNFPSFSFPPFRFISQRAMHRT